MQCENTQLSMAAYGVDICSVWNKIEPWGILARCVHTFKSISLRTFLQVYANAEKV